MTSPELIPVPDRVVSGQAYWLIRSEPYRCRDGREIALEVFFSHCATCGVAFEAKEAAGKLGALNRRCAEHRQPGVKA